MRGNSAGWVFKEHFLEDSRVLRFKVRKLELAAFTAAWRANLILILLVVPPIFLVAISLFLLPFPINLLLLIIYLGGLSFTGERFKAREILLYDDRIVFVNWAKNRPLSRDKIESIKRPSKEEMLWAIKSFFVLDLCGSLTNAVLIIMKKGRFHYMIAPSDLDDFLDAIKQTWPDKLADYKPEEKYTWVKSGNVWQRIKSRLSDSSSNPLAK